MGYTLLYAPCFHSEAVETRPNPRKPWPDPRTCPVCKKKRRVCEMAHLKEQPDMEVAK